MLLDEMIERGLPQETRMMRDVTRKFANEHVIPFTRQNWQREWNMKPEERLPRKILEVANEIGIRTLGIPEEFGGTPLDPKTETQTFAVISEEISRGDCGLSEKLVQIWKVRYCCATSRRAISRNAGFRRWSGIPRSCCRTASPSRAGPRTVGCPTTCPRR